MLTGTCCFHGCVEGQQVSLKGDFFNHLDDLGHLARRLVDGTDGGGQLLEGLRSALRCLLGLLAADVGLPRIIGVAASHGGQFLDGVGGLIQ